jgi:hypothetical protein
MREFESSHARMSFDDATILKVLSEYNPCEQAGSSVEDDFRLALVVDSDECAFQPPSIGREKGVDDLGGRPSVRPQSRPM